MPASEKQQQILHAAAECLARYGYDKTTMDDIARRIGLNKTSLYYYYRNKEAIFIAVIVQEAREFLAALQAKAVEAQGCKNQILTYLTERFHYYQHVVNLHNLSVETLQRIQPSFKAVYQTVLDREVTFIAKLLKEGMQRGEIKAGQASRLGRMILAVADGIKHVTCEACAHGATEAIDYSQVEKDVVYAVTLMLEGLALPRAPSASQGSHRARQPQGSKTV
ncbi:MAG: TetR/AcrR family transcriptional regulator [Desulfobacterales bacterium]|jgi:AcrR family transcriptional regulator